MIRELIFVLVALMGQIVSKGYECKMCEYMKGDKPVCGADGNTYLNKCYLKCNKVKKAYHGYCQSCNCVKLYRPVCGQSGTTYMNPCEANCRNDSVAHPGECNVQQCKCFDQQYNPVCGDNGRTYQNECEARCDGVNWDYKGVCGMCYGGNCRGRSNGDRVNTGLHAHENGGYVHYGFY